MFYWLSKTLDLLLAPTTWLFALLVWALLTKRPRRRKRLLWTLLLSFWVLTNRPLANWALGAWEVDPTPFSEVETHQYGVLLTGISDGQKEPNDRIYLVQGADRVTHSLQLWREGKIEQLLITGGDGAAGGSLPSEAVQLAELLSLMGMPDSVMIVEPKALNTYQNAVNAKAYLDSLGLGEQEEVVLITSGFHMRRAKACFSKQGIMVLPFACDYRTQPAGGIKGLFPDQEGLRRWTVLFREMFGLLVYKVTGKA